jgi:hypothetical protein
LHSIPLKRRQAAILISSESVSELWTYSNDCIDPSRKRFVFLCSLMTCPYHSTAVFTNTSAPFGWLLSHQRVSFQEHFVFLTYFIYGSE